MLSSSLRDGHLVDVYTWFGKIRCVVKQDENGYVCHSLGKGDVKVLVSKLFHQSKAMNSVSRWSYAGTTATGGEYIEYEEVKPEIKSIPSERSHYGINLHYNGAKS